MNDLAGKVAVVTGGGSGIGCGISHALADARVDVLIVDIESGPAEAVAAALRRKEVRAIAAHVDVADAASLDALVARTFEEFGAVHILCNNTGVFSGGLVLETPAKEWAWLFAVNVMGVVNGRQAFLPRMRSQGGEAHVVNTSSISGLYSTPNHGAYTASKYAVVGLSERLRVELEPDGIGVSARCPSGVATRIGESRRTRQPAFGGPVASRRPSPEAANRPRGMDPLEVGRLLVEGIKQNRRYIHTHLDVKRWVEDRFERILSDFAPLEAAAGTGT